MDEFDGAVQMLAPFIDHDESLSSIPFSNYPFFVARDLSIGSSPLKLDVDRRESFTSSICSLGPDIISTSSVRTTSPTTPSTVDSIYHMRSGSPYVPKATDISTYGTWGFEDDQLGNIDSWIPSESGHFQTSEKERYADTGFPHFSDGLPIPYLSNDSKLASQPKSNPSLSRPIFSTGDEFALSLYTSGDREIGFSSNYFYPPPQTIAPSATIQSTVTRWNNCTMEPMNPAPATPVTPLRFSGPSSVVLSSSPLSLYSQEDDSPCVSLVRLSTSPRDIQQSKRVHSRLSRRSYERKAVKTASRGPKPLTRKSGIDCDAVIAQNEFACGYSNCIDKATGKQKRFKRQEHKKRHERTVHEKADEHYCWVPDCKTPPFTRTDNLKSHLRNTHGKRSANARNRYVATQDKNSEHFDPDWEGPLTADGMPIRC